MMKQVLENGSADRILTAGVTAIIMWMSQGKRFGEKEEKFLTDRSLDVFFGTSQGIDGKIWGPHH